MRIYMIVRYNIWVEISLSFVELERNIECRINLLWLYIHTIEIKWVTTFVTRANKFSH